MKIWTRNSVNSLYLAYQWHSCNFLKLFYYFQNQLDCFWFVLANTFWFVHIIDVESIIASTHNLMVLDRTHLTASTIITSTWVCKTNYSVRIMLGCGRQVFTLLFLQVVSRLHFILMWQNKPLKPYSKTICRKSNLGIHVFRFPHCTIVHTHSTDQ